MLSNVDIISELNKNIFIYPLPEEHIRGSSVNLKASEWAWSITTCQSIVSEIEGNQIITIPANDTGLIETEEVIYTSKKISGTYHSKVSLVSAGMGHIGTTLDPTWCGNSLIAIHNHSSNPFRIHVGHTFVTIMFYYLKSNTTKINTNTSGQTEVLTEIGIPAALIPAELRAEWRKNPDDIIRRCNSTNELAKLKSLRNKFGLPLYRTKKFLYAIFPIILILIGVIIWFMEPRVQNEMIRANGILDWYLKVGLSGVLATYILLLINHISEG